MSIRNEYRMPALCFATAMLLSAHVAMAMPPVASVKMSVCTGADATLAARFGVSAIRCAGRRPHIHMTFSWVVHQAFMGNLKPIVEVVLAEVKQEIGSEPWHFSSVIYGPTPRCS